MADVVVAIKEAPAEPAQNVVQELGRLLSDAVKGDVVGIAFVEVRRGGDVSNGRALGKGVRMNDYAAVISDLFFATFDERASAYTRRDTPAPPQPAPGPAAGTAQESSDGKPADAPAHGG